jgi:phosphoglycerol transferase MdoB-like AlkP superfamily enzyme
MAYTPEFNTLINKGLYLDRFYANSVQTCKGQEAVFFSIVPTYKGKLFVDYPDLNISGFPALLADSGYETVFFQAYHDLTFDNTYNSMVKAGFTTVKSYKEFRKPEDRSYTWGWGVEDKIFYERFFTMLDDLHSKSPGRPVFAALSTIGTHIPCDGMPPEKMTIYKQPKEIKEKYSNALRLSDSQLPRFFQLLGEREYLKNSIVIITADHSFPMKEHGIYNNEKCFYDETFRIPFLVLWDGIILPERIKNRAYSQIDIGPTIMDMIGIYSAENTMTGISIFDRSDGNQVFLVQPYNGRYLQVVDYPFKYILHMQTEKEYLFNLEADSTEKFNLAGSGNVNDRLAAMKNSVKRIHVNQQLIDENRIRPVESR